MALTLEELRAGFKKEESTNSRPNNFYPFWNIPEGSQAVIRFLPDANEDNSMGFMVEKLMHNLTVNGETKSIPCHRMYDDDCPVCKVSAAYYKDKDEANGKKYWRKKQHLAQVLVVEDPLPPDEQTGETHEGKVRFVSLGFQIFNIIKDAFESGELDEIPYAFEGGCNFIIKKAKQGKYDSYTLSKFARKSSDLSDDEIALAKEHMVDLATLLPPQPDMVKTEAMLEASLTGATFEDQSNSGGTNSGTDFTKVAKKNVTESTTQKEPENDADEDNSDDSAEEYNDEANKILAQIRARQAAKG